MAQAGRSDAPLRVHITNCVLLNGGDAAIVEATIETLQRLLARPVEVTVFDQQPEVAARLFPQLRVLPWPWHVFCRRGGPRAWRLVRSAFAVGRASVAAFLIGRGAGALARPLLRRSELAFLTEYARADLVVSKGGTYLVERYRLAPHLFDFRLCLLLGRRLVLGPQSLGPFRRAGTRRELRRILSRATVFVRDERSRRHLLELGVPDAITTADSAFALASSERLAAAGSESVPGHPRIAISVREWGGPAERARYVEAMAALTTHLVRRYDASVVFLSTCQGVPEYVTDDSAVARAVVDVLPQDVTDRVELDSRWHAPSELRDLVADFDAVVATRLHFAILALAAGVPVLPIAYEFKTDELFARLGLADHVQPIRGLDPAGLTAAFDRFAAALPSCREELFHRVAAERQQALAALGQIADMLEPRQGLPPTGD